MQKIALCFHLASLLCLSRGMCQSPVSSTPYTPGTRVYVFTLSGLTLRSTPDIKGATMLIIPYGGTAEVLPDPSPEVAFINANISGHWTKVKYGTMTGYAFDGYLSRMQIIPDKVQVEDYLKKNFAIQDVITRPAGDQVIQSEVTKFKNGVSFEFKMYEGGVTRIFTFPQSAMTFKEVYLLCKAGNQEYSSAKSTCEYKPDHIRCENEEFMSVMVIEKKGDNTVVTESIAD